MISNQELDQLRSLRAGLFERLDNEQLSRVASVCEPQNYAAGEFIFRECDLSEDFYIVTAGAIRLGHDLDQSGQADIGQADVGDTFGEMSLFDELPRSMDAQAAVASHVLRIGRGNWLWLVEHDPALGARLLDYMAKEISFRLRRANWDLVLLRKGH